MTTSYPCTNHPRLLLVLVWICVALSAACLVIVIFVPDGLSSGCFNGIFAFALLGHLHAGQDGSEDEGASEET